MAPVCSDPCNKRGLEFVREHVKPITDDYTPDACTMIHNCRMVPGSVRCLAFRCPECGIWTDKKTAPDADDKELMSVHCLFKILPRVLPSGV